eukprot:TRINITY_DN14707_c0_g1_i1.p1 TRINITY_DN14707_c0_g1~~TRINITY_DN14707_c0_g1_i1.p1  ORF type:complete len:246 (+),score=32.13 TRINITY_DN14707_c0_g1_i1:60-740(+)
MPGRPATMRLATMMSTIGVKNCQAAIFEKSVMNLMRDSVAMERIKHHADLLSEEILSDVGSLCGSSDCSSGSDKMLDGFIDIQVHKGVAVARGFGESGESIDCLAMETEQVILTFPSESSSSVEDPTSSLDDHTGTHPLALDLSQLLSDFVATCLSTLSRLYNSILSMFSSSTPTSPKKHSTPSHFSYVALSMVCLMCFFAARRLPFAHGQQLIKTLWRFSASVLL